MTYIVLILVVIVIYFFFFKKREKFIPKINNILSPPIKEKVFSIKYEDSETGYQHYLVVDTETDGLPIERNGDAKDVNNWPRILQLSWMILDTDFKKVKFKNHYIKVDFEIDPEATAINNITKELLDEKGEDINLILKDFIQDVNETQIVVAHNLDFDVPVIDAELLRLGEKRVLFRKRKICTLKYGSGLTRLFGEYKKYPSLPFLCQILFGGVEKDFVHHDSKIDILLTAKVFEKLIEYDVVKDLWVRPK